MERILKLIVDNVNWIKINPTIKYEDIPERERDNNSWWYLHGKLEELVGYDKATAINCYSLGISKKTINWSSIHGDNVAEVFDENPYYRMYFNGKISVEIDGVDKPCVGYFWTTDEYPIYYKRKKDSYWSQRGLVCLADDKEACEYAARKMQERTRML